MIWGSTDNLKRRVRKLKQFEKTIRSQNYMRNDIPLVWGKFFDLKNNTDSKALYPLPKLLNMSKDEYKTITEDFFARVYYEIYAHIGITNKVIFDHTLLAKLDLSPVADETEVRKRFRELAKKHHPDAGGDHGRFLELMEVYKKLMDSGN